jgi:hypothetical protein
LDTLQLPNPLTEDTVNVVFPALDYLNLEGDWSLVSEDHLKAIVRNSADKKLIVTTEKTVFVDGEMSLNEFRKRKSENSDWNYDKFKPKESFC